MDFSAAQRQPTTAQGKKQEEYQNSFSAIQIHMRLTEADTRNIWHAPYKTLSVWPFRTFG